ncbi:MAG: hypothetical protein N838_04745 [Thiohalocapsa sp. PB-PSB1]|nr:MAG: hypothetical protein N838_04745 [Thiohalocapsa sp. PB-PSB1]
MLNPWPAGLLLAAVVAKALLSHAVRPAICTILVQ